MNDIDKQQKLQLKNINCILALKVTLEKTIPIERYSIREYKEEAICIDKDDDKWIVYDGERGLKHNCKVFKRAEFACHELIYRVSRTTVEKKKVLKVFNKALKEEMQRKIQDSDTPYTNSYYRELPKSDMVKSAAKKKVVLGELVKK